MPKKIILVRHGETDFNTNGIIQGHLDTFLNPEGLRQAQEVIGLLTNESIDFIFSSDLKRAYYTALTIGQALKKSVISTSLLRERFYGSLQGLTKKEISQFIHGFGDEGKWSGGWMDSVFNIETDKQIFQRLNEFRSILKEREGKTVVVVTHGGTIRILLKLFYFSSDFIKNLPIKNTSCFILKKKNNRYELKITPSGFLPLKL